VIEEIARHEKREIRRRLMLGLRRLIEAAGGAWVKLGAYPFPHRSAFNFRIDYDDYEPEDFERTLAALAGHEDATSHFVCASPYEGRGEALDRLRGLDVGSHGYWHHTYRDFDDNLENIRRGIEVLQSAGIEPSGFVAPHGRFNAGLHEAMQRLGVGHSSEFGLAYDDLPFLPRGGDVLQIPVDPVSLGIVLEAAARRATSGVAGPALERKAADAASEYYAAAARTRYELGEPLFFYDHPTRRLGRYPQVLGDLFAVVDGFAAVWKTTFSQFAAWWRQRARLRLNVARRGEEFVVQCGGLPRGHRPALELWRDDRVAVMPLDRPQIAFSPEALAFQRRAAARPLVRPKRIDERPTLKNAVKRMIDWEKVTPADEIRVRSWRGLMKKALRYLRPSDEEIARRKAG
jgi:hypothetical protein